MSVDEKTNKVTIKMPPSTYIWIKGYDTQWKPIEDNDKPDWDNLGNQPEEKESNYGTIIGVSIGGVLVVVGIVVGVFVFIKLKRKKDDNLEDKVNKFNIKE